MKQAAHIDSRIGGGDATRITVRGVDLVDGLLGRHGFVDTFFLACFGRFPEPNMRRMVNALLVTSVDHGLTPSALATRLTLHGSPEAMQGAVAAGLLGAGSRFLGSVEYSCNYFRESLEGQAQWTDDALATHAAALAAQARHAGRRIPGFGHPIHAEGDPRVARLLALADECGFRRVHCSLALLIGAALSEQAGRMVPLNAAGVKGAILADMGLPAEFAKGLSIVGRAAGLIAHVMEERERPISQAVWDLVEQANRASDGASRA